MITDQKQIDLVASRFQKAIDQGWKSPVRFQPGDGLNVWGKVPADLAKTIAHFELPFDLYMSIEALFIEIGQLSKDYQNASGLAHERINQLNKTVWSQQAKIRILKTGLWTIAGLGIVLLIIIFRLMGMLP